MSTLTCYQPLMGWMEESDLESAHAHARLYTHPRPTLRWPSGATSRWRWADREIRIYHPQGGSITCWRRRLVYIRPRGLSTHYGLSTKISGAQALTSLYLPLWRGTWTSEALAGLGGGE